MAEVRAMTMDDYDQVIDLWRRTPDFRPGSFPPDVVTRYLTRNPDLSTVAVADRQVIGTILCGHDGRRGSLYNVTVAPEFRKQGIAKKMLEGCQNGLKAEGIRVAFRFTYAHNKDAAAFWAHEGWVAAPHIVYHDKAL